MKEKNSGEWITRVRRLEASGGEVKRKEEVRKRKAAAVTTEAKSLKRERLKDEARRLAMIRSSTPFAHSKKYLIQRARERQRSLDYR